MDWQEKKLSILLDAGKTAVQRARYVFITIIIAGTLLLTAQFNATLPWIRNMLHRENVKSDVKGLARDISFKELSVVQVPLLGVKFSVYDLSVVGTAAMAVLSVWFFYAVRREHYVVATIKAEADEAIEQKDTDRAVYLYYGIAHYFVYTTTTQQLTPANQKPQAVARRAVVILEHMPVWVPAIVVLVDLGTLFVPRYLYQLNEAAAHTMLWVKLSRGEQIEAAIRMVIAILGILFCWYQCRNATIFDRSTRAVMANFEDEVSPFVPKLEKQPHNNDRHLIAK
ncbi:MAG: hypothetical protein QOG71_3910 [Pyrinomonadaceae bacterium]|nr:hypothetical protein [Pyrinomonadaceae bacterium]